eukprot:GHVU01058171.1.p1 GENE.GHVU01058171.1~~GHVU01058171.1.p1  ORF type:complete len:160 (-),score=9.69 GHVU01058171.1:618-1097(-)
MHNTAIRVWFCPMSTLVSKVRRLEVVGNMFHDRKRYLCWSKLIMMMKKLRTSCTFDAFLGKPKLVMEFFLIACWMQEPENCPFAPSRSGKGVKGYLDDRPCARILVLLQAHVEGVSFQDKMYSNSDFFLSEHERLPTLGGAAHSPCALLCPGTAREKDG